MLNPCKNLNPKPTPLLYHPTNQPIYQSTNQLISSRSPAFRLIKDHNPVLLTLTQLLLFISRQCNNLLAFQTATAIVFFCTGLALDKKQMAGLIAAIGMCIA